MHAAEQSETWRLLGRTVQVIGPERFVAMVSASIAQVGEPTEDIAPERIWHARLEGNDTVTVMVGDRGLVTSTPLETAARVTYADLELWAAENARGLVVLHAGVVTVAGRAIVLPGRSFAGKSTLVAALLHLGALYYSDEYAPIDASGYVHAYPRGISLRSQATAPHHSLATSRPSVPIAVFAALRYSTSHRGALGPTSRASALMSALDNCVCAETRPTEALTHLTAALSHSRCLRNCQDLWMKIIMRRC